MRGYSKKLLTGVSLIAFMLGSFQGEVLAKDDKKENTHSYRNVLRMEPSGERVPLQELAHSSNVLENKSFEKRLQLADLSQRPPEAMKEAKQAVPAKKYTIAELNQLSNQNLVDLLVTINWEQISGLFQFNNDSLAFYQNDSRMQAIIDKLAQQGQTYTKDDSKGIETLVEVLRSGFYLGFYHNELSKLYERSYRDKCLPALKAIAENPNFKLGTSEQNKVVSLYGKLIGNASSDAEIISLAAPIFKQFNDNLSTYVGSRSAGSAVYDLMQGIDYDIQSYLYDTEKGPKDTMWYRKIDSYINELSRFALIGTVTDQNGWLINNGLYYTGRLGMFHSTPTKGLQVVTEALKVYPYLSEQYFVAAEQITTNYGGKDANGKVIDLDQIREDGKKKYLPKTYTFDDGAIVLKAGDKVTEEKVKRLYWAAKEVKAQFHRTVESDKSLEQGNPDDVLTMVIYNSPEEYQFNRQLYGYETNNGGIYIEGTGTFFTYERTPEESIYSLEELFRHEFTHYLQGRYEVPGLWGQGKFYENERLSWFEEGNAEFFAGATRTDNVVPRKSIIGGLSSNPADRYTAEKTLNAKYGTWDFYNYSFALQSYMYNKRYDMFDKIHDLIRKNDVQGYDAYRSALSKDQGLNKEYQDYMQMLIDNREKYNVPLVSDDYLANHAPKPVSDIASDITAEARLKDVKVTKHKSQFFNTFTLQGTYTGDAAKGEYEDWKTITKTVNDSLKRLSAKEWTGYKTLTAYFVNYRVNASGQMEYDVVFHGINTEGNTENKAPIAVVNGPYTGNVNESISFKSDGSKDEDGQILSYKWEFGDGQTSGEKNPSHVYTKEGTYTAKLTVTDDKGVSTSVTTSVTVQKKDTGSVETEPNNSFKTANKITLNQLLRASLSDADNNDFFEINVETAKNLQISVTKENNIGVNWVLYSAADLNNYITYAQPEGNKLVGSYYTYPGKYYLHVYKYSGGSGNYTVEVK
ncbi:MULTISPECIES: collagenase ColA [Bacillus cereus group]|uniref:collagenase ColA n=1 Tax=Bacillus cereus group TaxID=86661 RepID=UPI000BF38E57|nr:MULTISPECIES: collagenase ColA [Bacillus cereus group]PFO84623.1 collagenase [Bacillus cereus]